MRLEEIAASVDVILETGTRTDVLRLLAFLAGKFAVAKIRARELRHEEAKSGRDLTVKQAAHQYPISSSFLYERGEQLGIVHKTPEGKVTVIEVALRKYLEGK